MKIKRYLFLLLIFTGISLQVNSQSFIRANGKVIVNENGDTVLLKGMGLGGWMLQEGYMLQTSGFANAQYQIRDKIEQLIGVAATDSFYNAWLQNHVRKIDIDSLKSWGFNCVRLPMHYNLFTLPVEQEPVAGENTWLAKGFELTDSLISWCKQNQIYVILDLHAAPGGQGKDQGISDYDPTKPSLWENKLNRDKTVALWKKIAETYASEPWIGGYDLLNEPNWIMTGNSPLRDLYYEITDSIRSVDSKHILFIEGNWFANDFAGLTPPWDSNMVYSPHKYWSKNDQASIQWVLDIRDDYNVPIWFGESGENSNIWFRNAIKLLEENNMGWAMWPMKKVESIAGPLSAAKPVGYQALLDYWNGTGTAPTVAMATNALLQLANNLKLENCIYHKDVIDAMIRQVRTDTTIPFRTQTIPGVVYSTDYDMGLVGSSYFDIDLANYQSSTGNYTAWNQGWEYRNDGVDIQETEDIVNTNGYDVGWLAAGEWMQYDVSVATSAIYDINVRIAANGTDGKFHFSTRGSSISGVINVPSTGGWQNWQTVVVSDVVLGPADQKIRFYVDGEGFNLGSFNFIQKGPTTTLPTTYLSAVTINDHTIQLYLNKPLADPIPASPADFSIFINGSMVSITDAVLNTANPRIIQFSINQTIKSSDVIKISFSGNQINALDGTSLNVFSLKEVQNAVAIIHPVPGRVEAEEFFFQSGIQLENSTDVGGGQNIGYLDQGDYLDYYINVGQAGTYNVDYRTAALSEIGQIQLQLIDSDGSSTILHTVSFPSTGGWQTWATTSNTVDLPAGLLHIRLEITQPLFNMNWFEFALLTATDNPHMQADIKLFPNPGAGLFNLEGAIIHKQGVEIIIYNLLGQPVWKKSFPGVIQLRELINLQPFPAGYYMLMIRVDDGSVYTRKIVYR